QTALSGMANVTKVAAGADHSLALKSDGTVVASGLDSYGQCQVPPTLTGVISIAAGEEHSLALRSNGTVAAWGANTFGQSTVPAGLTGVVAIAAGGYHSLALKSDGKVVAWGANGSGQSTVPSTLTNVVAIAAGGFHSLALRSDGTITGWGRNNEAQRIPPSGLSGVVAISAGWRHSLALRSDGTPVGWGLNESAQCLGPVSINPAPNSKNIPIDTVFRIVYSAPVKAGDAYSQITLEDSQGSPVASTRTISGTLLTVTPSVALKTDERYVLRVPAGSLKDDFNTSVIGVTYLFDTLDTVPPVVASVVPAHGATGVLPGYGTDVRVTFSESIVLGNNADAIVLSGPQGPVARTVGISLGALRIIPVDGLAPETTYTLTVPAGTVTDLAGNALVTTFASSFTTGAADTTPPVVVSVSPTNGATGVLNTISAVRVTMSEPVLPGPAFFDITLRDTAGNPVEIHRWRDGNVLNVSPVDLLAPQTTYTLNVPAGA
ncbi:MAG: Ig-like domain-containing protein, partial [Actinomycetota bacterium]|nr:Ig-like domain-containing protein [Actinomycetota bacterium]